MKVKWTGEKLARAVDDNVVIVIISKFFVKPIEILEKIPLTAIIRLRKGEGAYFKDMSNSLETVYQSSIGAISEF